MPAIFAACARRKAGARRFAFEANVHRTYVSDIERGARNPTITVVEKLAMPLGVTASDLLAK
jgi:transcriptional regulator with XRE-family HTH domain